MLFYLVVLLHKLNARAQRVRTHQNTLRSSRLTAKHRLQAWIELSVWSTRTTKTQFDFSLSPQPTSTQNMDKNTSRTAKPSCRNARGSSTSTPNKSKPAETSPSPGPFAADQVPQVTLQLTPVARGNGVPPSQHRLLQRQEGVELRHRYLRSLFFPRERGGDGSGCGGADKRWNAAMEEACRASRRRAARGNQ